MAKRKPTFGTRHPLARAYVFEVGTCVSSFIYLEEYLRQYVLNCRVLAAKWPLQPKKLEKILDSLDKRMLPDLISQYEALTDDSSLAEEMRRLSFKRNAMMHIVPPIHDSKTFRLLSGRIQQHRQLMKAISGRVHAALLRLEEAENEVFAQMEERRAKEPSGNPQDLAVMAKLLERRQAKFESELRA